MLNLRSYNMKRGILLVNLGTPAALDVPSIRSYLREFLGDPRVLDIPWIARKVLLNGIILPFRPRKTLKAYARIWQDEGSPLMIYSEQFAKKLSRQLGDEYHVELAMRYGQPSIESKLEKMLDQVDHLSVIPLYPQYSAGTTGSVIEKTFDIIGKRWNIPSMDVWADFYDKPWYLETQAQHVKSHLESFGSSHVLISFHGLPVRQVEKSDLKECDQSKPCPVIGPHNRFCYRAQSYHNARALAKLINLEDYTVCFQSRLGRIPWIKPYTDELLPGLIEQGHKRISVICPSFVVDCLETLDEIGIELKEEWCEMGGEDLQLVPALNAQDAWVEAFSRAIKASPTKPMTRPIQLKVSSS